MLFEHEGEHIPPPVRFSAEIFGLKQIKAVFQISC